MQSEITEGIKQGSPKTFTRLRSVSFGLRSANYLSPIAFLSNDVSPEALGA